MKTLKLGVAGLGNVGEGLIDLVHRQDEARLPGRVEIVGVSARNRNRARKVSIAEYDWYDDPSELASLESVDVFVELIGGADGPAKRAVETALRAGKHVISANKALVAEHGEALARLAEQNGVSLLFEAAVAGGIPVVRVLRESLAGVQVKRVTGILNGTCNYLLTEMLSSGRSYADVLADAQRLGYAEADPFLDVSGTDAAHKIAILSAIAFSAELDFPKVSIRGVDQIDLMDLQLADRLGFAIKLIAEGRRTERGVMCSVAPRALAKSHPLASIGGALNTVRIEADALGSLILTGPGAGSGPTASAVIGDVARLFMGEGGSMFGRLPDHPIASFINAEAETQQPWFLRVRLLDRPGALAALSEALAEAGVSVDKLIQDSAVEGASPVALTTHPCSVAQIENAYQRIAGLKESADAPHLILIEGGNI